eukprot:300676-Amphidinium_carterae.3
MCHTIVSLAIITCLMSTRLKAGIRHAFEVPLPHISLKLLTLSASTSTLVRDGRWLSRESVEERHHTARSSRKSKTTRLMSRRGPVAQMMGSASIGARKARQVAVKRMPTDWVCRTHEMPKL